jgi:hypothetical protein
MTWRPAWTLCTAGTATPKAPSMAPSPTTHTHTHTSTHQHTLTPRHHRGGGFGEGGGGGPLVRRRDQPRARAARSRVALPGQLRQVGRRAKHERARCDPLRRVDVPTQGQRGPRVRSRHPPAALRRLRPRPLHQRRDVARQRALLLVRRHLLLRSLSFCALGWGATHAARRSGRVQVEQGAHWTAVRAEQGPVAQLHAQGHGPPQLERLLLLRADRQPVRVALQNRGWRRQRVRHDSCVLVCRHAGWWG